MVNRQRGIIYKDSDQAVAFGKNFKSIRKSKGMSQTELALEAAVERSTVIRLESGKFNPTLDLIFTLAEALKVHPKELFDY